MQLHIDREFGNVLIILSNKKPVKSEEGFALVTVGIGDDGEVVYISIEPEDRELARFISSVRAKSMNN